MNDLEHGDPLVLIVDDEAAIREAVQDILELSDFRTITACNGQEALDLFDQHRDRIRVVLLDLRMPVLSGPDTYHRLRELDPVLTIVLSSGYDESMVTMEFGEDPNLFFLHKPYAMAALLEHVNRGFTA
jgi:two-component system, cell cycle sensor histidine kinase and response regulator CckA